MIDKVFINGDIDGLRYFANKDNICAYNSRIVNYAMQGENIVGIFYTQVQAISFYNANRYKEGLPILYYWSEDRWNKRNTN